MNTYIALFLIATCASLTLTPLVRRLCARLGWLDEPRDERRIHHRAVPRLGGVAIFASVLIALMTLPFVDNFITQSLRANRSALLTVLLPAALVFLFGVYDDLKGTNAWWKFIAQGLAGALLYVLGGRIISLSVPFVGSVELPQALGFAITVLWVVGISNAFNLIDGMDGLAAGAALFASFVVLAVSLVLGHPLVTVITIALSGALIGFLRYNFNPASIFLGDSGSLFVGFTLAALSVQGAQKASTAVAVAIPLMAFGVPIIDTGFTIMRRFISGRPLFQGDREHIHHMLLARGWSQRRVAFVLYAVCALFGLLALFAVNDAGGRITGLILLVIGAAVVLAVGRLRYHEVDEIKASVRRNLALSDRRQRATHNIRIRRASRALSEAMTLNELFDAVQEMLELGEFAYATVQLGHGGNGASCEWALARGNGARSLHRAELHDGMIRWTWERGDIEAAQIIGSSRFWTLRLPLANGHDRLGYINLYRELSSEALLLDINYLCDLFQKEMVRAAARVLAADQQEVDAHRLSASAGSGD